MADTASDLANGIELNAETVQTDTDEVEEEQKLMNMEPKGGNALTAPAKGNGHIQRSSTQFTKSKMQCWMSLDMHLNDILLAQERFVMNAFLIVFWKDAHGDFKALFDKETLTEIKEHGFILYDDLNPSIRKKLPFKTGFLLNSADMEIEKCYLEVFDEEEGVWKLYFRFNCSCAEHFELTSFPFDSQFLNLQMMYRLDDYDVLSKCPDWITKDDKHLQFKLDKPLKLTVKDSIKTEWKIYEPWVDMRKNRGDYNFHFSVIRLRVRRNPIFYLLNGVLPLFLVITCSFAQFVMPFEENLGDKLAYIVTLLLTTAAFQYALSAGLPKTSESTMIDIYILYAYAILTVYVLEIAIISRLKDRGFDDVAQVADFVVAILFALVWLWRTGLFVYGYWQYKHRDVEWQRLSDEEYQGWSDDMKGDTKYIGVAAGKFQGTNDK